MLSFIKNKLKIISTGSPEMMPTKEKKQDSQPNSFNSEKLSEELANGLRESARQVEVVENFEEAVEKIKVEAEQRIEADFGANGKKETLPFHGVEHSRMVAEKSVESLKTIQDIDPNIVSDKDIALVKLEAWWHDVVQDKKNKDGKFRERSRGENERKSAEALYEEIQHYKDKDGDLIFTDSKESIIADITTTEPTGKPGFEELPDGSVGLKMDQPNLKPESSLRGFVIAQADLRNEVSNGSPEAFRKGGDAEFRELNENISTQIKQGVDKITQEDMTKIATSILGWKKVQIGFAKWQKELFLKNLDQNKTINDSSKAEEIKKALKDLYGVKEDSNGSFDKNIKASQQRYDDLEKGYSAEKLSQINRDDFVRLLEETGYSKKDMGL